MNVTLLPTEGPLTDILAPIVNYLVSKAFFGKACSLEHCIPVKASLNFRPRTLSQFSHLSIPNGSAKKKKKKRLPIDQTSSRSSRFLAFHRLVQVLVASLSGPSTPWKMAWQKAWQSASTRGGPHLWSPTFEVSMKVRNTPSSCARKTSSSVPSRITAPGKSVVNFGITTFLDTVSGCRSPSLHHDCPPR